LIQAVFLRPAKPTNIPHDVFDLSAVPDGDGLRQVGEQRIISNP
jgi:hypothetical protein